MESALKIKSRIEMLPDLFVENNEWIKRYDGYAKDIVSNKEKWSNMNIRIANPLYRYSSVSARNQRKYDLRFAGQSIGHVICKRDGNIILYGNKSNEEGNIKTFGKDLPILPKEGVAWNSKEASQFRSFFNDMNNKDINTKSPEHKLESRLLAEFAKGSSRDKALLNIQPVRLFDCFFQMPTPISASGHEIKYVNQSGGGIDILARCKHSDGSVHLCVMEVKDENEPNEPQAKAMEQALSYATFIASLLRNPQIGDNWWKIFGFNSKIPADNFLIDVITIMPQGITDEFEGTIELPALNTTLQASTLYFDNSAYAEGRFVFTGTFTNILKK